MSKYGNWVVSESVSQSDDKCWDISIEHDDGWSFLAEVVFEKEANIMAASIDLLEACESMLDTCGAPENWNGETYKSLILIRDAVEKATKSPDTEPHFNLNDNTYRDA